MLYVITTQSITCSWVNAPANGRSPARSPTPPALAHVRYSSAEVVAPPPPTGPKGPSPGAPGAPASSDVCDTRPVPLRRRSERAASAVRNQDDTCDGANHTVSKWRNVLWGQSGTNRRCVYCGPVWTGTCEHGPHTHAELAFVPPPPISTLVLYHQGYVFRVPTRGTFTAYPLGVHFPRTH